MSELIAIAVVAVIVFGIIAILFYKFIGGSPKNNKPKKNKDRDAIMKEANRRLGQNPKDAQALQEIADIYFGDGDFDKAGKAYRVLMGMTMSQPELDEYIVNLRYGLCSLKAGQTDEAYKALMVAKALKPEYFEVNYNLGVLEFQRKVYDKAFALLRNALTSSPDHAGTIKHLGQCLFRLKQFKEAASYLKKSVDLDPTDKETLFFLGQTYFELGQSDNAVKIFGHLRGDPVIGPQAALFSGTINYNSRQYEKSIMDLEIGLRHKGIPTDQLLEMKYRIAASYNQMQNIDAALKQLKEIRLINSNYKDVTDQVRKLQEFSANKNLHIYMAAPMSDFVNLCRNMVSSAFFPKAGIKITDIAVQKTEFCDITAEVNTSKWDDVILFRFLRSNTQTGELFLRDMQARAKEVHAGRGFCITSGAFTPTAKAYVEARLIDLVEKDALLKALETL